MLGGMILLSLFLILLVAGSSTAVMIIFFRRLKNIEEELWGLKEKEAIQTASKEQLTQETTQEKPNYR